MKKNLTARSVIIVVTILVCVFGIIGVPKSGADIVKNFNENTAGPRLEGRQPSAA